jgi:hypothetical protein
MAIAALVAWIATALGGLTLAGTWLAHRGPAQHRDGHSRLAPKLLASHFGLAAAGLVIWIIATTSDTDGLRWVSLALLPMVAGLGLVMFLKWLGGRGAHAGTGEADPPAEQRFPVAVVALHGILAVITLALVTLAAAGVGT